MKSMLIVAAALVGFAATANAAGTVQSCGVIGYIENAESGQALIPVYSSTCVDVVSGNALGVINGVEAGSLEVVYGAGTRPVGTRTPFGIENDTESGGLRPVYGDGN